MTLADKDIVDNRRNILDTALDLFYAKGYEAVGVQEIATKAGVTKPTLYYYFKSKYGLLENVLEDTIEGFMEALMKAVDEGKGLVYSLETVAKVYIEYIMASRKNMKAFHMFLSMEYSPPDSESHKAIEKYVKDIFVLFLNLFTANAKELGNMNGRQEQFAMGYMGILNYYLLVNKERCDENEIHSLVHQFMHGIFS